MSRKGDPIPTKYDPAEEGMLRDLNETTGLSMAEIVRRANRFALPKFLSGQVNILDLVPTKANGASKRRRRETANT